MSYWDRPLSVYLLYFQEETPRVLHGWDRTTAIESLPDCLDWMVVVKPLPCGDGYIQPGFQYNGASVGWFRYVPFFGFPKWRHPIATARHDFRCGLMTLLHEVGTISTKEAQHLRRIADELFKKDIALGQTNAVRSWWEQTKGYIGVRVGAITSRQYGLMRWMK